MKPVSVGGVVGGRGGAQTPPSGDEAAERSHNKTKTS